MLVSAWRVADPLYAASVEEMLSGDGAKENGGRWNSEGLRVVYLSGNLATATVEILVHLENKGILDKYHKLKVSFPVETLVAIDEGQLPDNWNSMSMEPVTQAVGNDWLVNKESLVLRVPSVAVPDEYNYLLNPDHDDFSRLEVGEIEPYTFDERLRR